MQYGTRTIRSDSLLLVVTATLNFFKLLVRKPDRNLRR